MALVRIYTWDVGDVPLEQTVDIGGGGLPPTELIPDETITVPDRRQLVMGVSCTPAAGAGFVLGENAGLVMV